MSSTDGGLRAEFRKHIPHFDWSSIETGSSESGVPDNNFCYEGAEGWIEFKQTALREVRLRPDQIGWLAKRARHGGHVFVGVRRWHDPRWSKFSEDTDQFWLLEGGASVVVKQRGLRESERYVLGIWEGGPSRWDWNAIASILTRRVPIHGTEDTSR